MYILPTDSIFNIAVLVLLILLFLGVAALLFSVHKFLSKWLETLQAGKIAGVEVIRDEAQRNSMRLVQEATLKAQEIVANAAELSEDTKVNIDSALKEISTRQGELIRQALEQQKDIGLHSIQSATKKIEGEVLDEISQFEDIVHKETVESEKLIEEKVNKDYEGAKAEIEKYRAEEMAKVDDSVFNILKEVTTQVLGNALSMEGHRDLVLDALQEAKRNQLFQGAHDDIRR